MGMCDLNKYNMPQQPPEKQPKNKEKKTRKTPKNKDTKNKKQGKKKTKKNKEFQKNKKWKDRVEDSLAHRNRSDFCDFCDCDAHRRPQNSQRFLSL